jgi:LCP family protein required for cell wall assembly
LFAEEEYSGTKFGGEYNFVEIVKRKIDEEEPKNTISYINVLVLGLDDDETRSDVIALINYNPIESKMKILSIARDTRVRVNGKYTKINSLIGKGGEKLVVDMVEEITGLPIDYYITLNFKGFREIVDILGGVEIDVPFDMDYDDPYQNLHIHLKKGKQVLDGKKAEEFVRYRKGNHSGEGYEDGDLGRIKMQQLFIEEFVKQKLKLKYLLKADEIFYTLKKNMRTNIEIGDIRYFIKNVKNIKTPAIEGYTLPGYSRYIGSQWFYIYNKKETKKLIEENFRYDN